MGAPHSKPPQPMTAEKVMGIMEQYPEFVKQYYDENQEEVEEYIVENFWEEDVDRWLTKIRNRSPKENLQVRKIDYLKKRNAFLHRCKYENKSLVIRRAADFHIDVLFGNRPFDPERDDISISFGVGPTPSEATKTKISCIASEKPGQNTKWYCVLEEVDNEAKKVTLRIHVPANAIIGRYGVSLEIVSGTQEGRVKSTHKDASVIVLFNPFSKDDAVYMEKEEWRNEYVLEDEGLICVGAYKNDPNVRYKKWDFGQFDEGVLDGILMMIQNDSRVKAQKAKAIRKCDSPVFVSRILAAMVNSSDDSGILVGKWRGSYDDGTKPNSWTDSPSIIREWKENEMTAVKYGQCWVFSGILTTALRALGIPARAVTNYSSAHDTDMNQTVDLYYNVNTGDKLDETSDSVWNFHVWNEGWFARPDLPEGYGGWQVVDATPQESSAIKDSAGLSTKTLMQCGPAPVKAVKEGDINVGSDTGFVFSEVNADKVYWWVDDDGKLVSPPLVLKSSVGKFIGTKAVGKMETENIIDQYKYQEGSEKERTAFNKAYGLGTQKHEGFETQFKLMEPAFKITIDEAKDATYGQDVAIKISVENVSGKQQEATLKFNAAAMNHVGSRHATIKKVNQKFEVEQGKSKSFDFILTAAEYTKLLVDDLVINNTATVVCTSDGNTSLQELDVDFVLPECITVTAPAEIPWGETVEFEATITNKLPFPLTNGELRVIGRGVDTGTYHTVLEKPLQPGESFSVNGKAKAKYGWHRLNGMVKFECAELDAMRQHFKIRVSS